jgi:hypothetical protein
MAHETLAPWAAVVPNAPYPMTAEQLLAMGMRQVADFTFPVT